MSYRIAAMILACEIVAILAERPAYDLYIIVGSCILLFDRRPWWLLSQKMSLKDSVATMLAFGALSVTALPVSNDVFMPAMAFVISMTIVVYGGVSRRENR